MSEWVNEEGKIKGAREEADYGDAAHIKAENR